jgi:hypothetical protein
MSSQIVEQRQKPTELHATLAETCVTREDQPAEGRWVSGCSSAAPGVRPVEQAYIHPEQVKPGCWAASPHRPAG